MPRSSVTRAHGCAPARRRARGEGLHARRRRARAARRRRRGRRASGRCSRSARTAASPRCTSARRRGRRARCCSPSTTTAGRRRTRPGWEHHDRRGRRSRDRPHGHAAVLPAHDRGRRSSKTSSSRSSVIRSPVARGWRTPLGFLFIDGGHAEMSRWPTTRAGRRTSCPAACSPFHDVFEDPADGGQAPFHVWQRAVADGFAPRLDHRLPPSPRRAKSDHQMSRSTRRIARRNRRSDVALVTAADSAARSDRHMAGVARLATRSSGSPDREPQPSCVLAAISASEFVVRHDDGSATRSTRGR